MSDRTRREKEKKMEMVMCRRPARRDSDEERRARESAAEEEERLRAELRARELEDMPLRCRVVQIRRPRQEEAAEAEAREAAEAEARARELAVATAIEKKVRCEMVRPVEKKKKKKTMAVRNKRRCKRVSRRRSPSPPSTTDGDEDEAELIDAPGGSLADAILAQVSAQMTPAPPPRRCARPAPTPPPPAPPPPSLILRNEEELAIDCMPAPQSRVRRPQKLRKCKRVRKPKPRRVPKTSRIIGMEVCRTAPIRRAPPPAPTSSTPSYEEEVADFYMSPSTSSYSGIPSDYTGEIHETFSSSYGVIEEVAPEDRGYWEDQVKYPLSPQCKGEPGSRVLTLAQLAVKSILDNGIVFRGESSPLGASDVGVVEHHMRRYPNLGLARGPGAEAWPEATVAALMQSPEEDDCLPVVNVAVDLEDHAKRVYALVTESRGWDPLGDPGFVGVALGRYHKFMGLVADHPDAGLVPALDILTVWYSHIIRTELYKSYCWHRTSGETHRLIDRRGPLIVLDAFGKVLTEDDDWEVLQAVEKTKELWSQKYGGEEYVTNLAEVSATLSDDALTLSPMSTVSVEDVIRDRDWVDDLHGMVGEEGMRLLQMGDSEYLRKRIRAYERFLYLNAKYGRDVYLSVALDVDLIWHAHQIHPACYEMDCLRMFGFDVPHIPWPVHSEAEDAENSSFLGRVWEEVFGVGFGTR